MTHNEMGSNYHDVVMAKTNWD